MGNATADRAVALAIFALALALRLAHLTEVVEQPDFDRPLVDAGYHDRWAWSAVSGESASSPEGEDPRIDEHPYFRPPLTTYVLMDTERSVRRTLV
jgi:hypothetical protein